MNQAPRSNDGLFRPRVYYALTLGAFGIYLPFIYVYLEQERHLNGRQIAALAAIPPLMTLVIAPIWCSLADSHGSRLQALRLAVIGTAASVLLVGLPGQFVLILLTIVLYNFFQAAVSPLGDGILASVASRRKIPYGNLRMWGSFGYAIGGILFGQIGHVWGLSSLFPSCALFLLLSLPVLWHMVSKEPPPPVKQSGSRLALLKDRTILQFLVIAGLGSTGISTGYLFLYIYLGDLGASPGLIGAVSAVGALIEVLFMYWGGKLIRRHSALSVFAAGMGIYGLGWICYALLRQPWMALLVQLFLGAGVGLLLPAAVTFIALRAPSQQTATAQSLLNAVMYGIAPLLASLIAGNVFDLAGARVVLALASAIVGAGILLYFILRKRIQTQSPDSPK